MIRTFILTVFLSFPLLCGAVGVGDRVVLIERDAGIPGHPEPGNPGVSQRFPGGIVVNVRNIDTETSWLEVEDPQGTTAWIVSRYIESVLALENSPAPDALCYRVGTWNIEHFTIGKKRGFPENTSGGPSYPERTVNDIAAISAAIRDEMQAKILVLTEINGEERLQGDTYYIGSDELDLLVNELGTSYQYVIGESGRSQRVALLYDTRYVRLNAALELPVARIEVQGKDIFDRDPLMGHFTFLHNGEPMNDLLVVGLHLASGQHNARNHDAAMSTLVSRIADRTALNGVLPGGEHDIILTGDLNASMFDNHKEQFFDDLNQGQWDVLAEEGYPPTRLGDVQPGEPFTLGPRSYLDYVIATRHLADRDGLVGDEIVAQSATVHHELANGQWDTFRRVYSDHFPVTTCVGVQADTDQ